MDIEMIDLYSNKSFFNLFVEILIKFSSSLELMGGQEFVNLSQNCIYKKKSF